MDAAVTPRRGARGDQGGDHRDPGSGRTACRSRQVDRAAVVLGRWPRARRSPAGRTVARTARSRRVPLDVVVLRPARIGGQVVGEQLGEVEAVRAGQVARVECGRRSRQRARRRRRRPRGPDGQQCRLGDLHRRNVVVAALDVEVAGQAHSSRRPRSIWALASRPAASRSGVPSEHGVLVTVRLAATSGIVRRSAVHARGGLRAARPGAWAGRLHGGGSGVVRAATRPGRRRSTAAHDGSSPTMGSSASGQFEGIEAWRRSRRRGAVELAGGDPGQPATVASMESAPCSRPTLRGRPRRPARPRG